MHTPMKASTLLASFLRGADGPPRRGSRHEIQLSASRSGAVQPSASPHCIHPPLTSAADTHTRILKSFFEIVQIPCDWFQALIATIFHVQRAEQVYRHAVCWAETQCPQKTCFHLNVCIGDTQLQRLSATRGCFPLIHVLQKARHANSVLTVCKRDLVHMEQLGKRYQTNQTCVIGKRDPHLNHRVYIFYFRERRHTHIDASAEVKKLDGGRKCYTGRSIRKKIAKTRRSMDSALGNLLLLGGLAVYFALVCCVLPEIPCKIYAHLVRSCSHSCSAPAAKHNAEALLPPGGV